MTNPLLFVLLVLLVLGVILLGAVAYLLTLPAGYTVERRITIQKPREQVFAYVHDLANWPHWSPWIIHDLQTQMTYATPNSVSGSYAWASPLIGAGSMTNRAAQHLERIDFDLRFIKPFKNQADVRFDFMDNSEIKENSPACTVVWTTAASLPLYVRPMRGMLQRMIGNDFELGLGMLRGRVDPTASYPVITFAEQPTTLASQTLLAREYAGPISGLKDIMAQIYPALWAKVDPSQVAGPSVAAYHKINIKGMSTVCDIGIPIAAAPAGERVVQLPGGRYYQTTLRGSYEFIGPAWNAAYGHCRMLKLKEDKSRPMLEIYPTSPAESPNPNDWITTLAIPIRG